MSGPRYLLDASSLVRALKEAKLSPLGGQALQWLTIYEALNALWKEAYLLRRIDVHDALSLATVIAEVARNMVVLEPAGLEEEILEIAVTRGVTVYDASYIALARKHGLILVTEDRKLRQAASELVRVASLDQVM